MRNISPYLKALKAFEAAARHQSFSQAAQELYVTPAAVGQLVKQLETQLGVELFQRQSAGQQRLTLSDRAKHALPDIQTGFEYLGKGLACLQQCADNRILTLTVSPAFASKWLLPRLEDFQQCHPHIAVRLYTDSKPLDFQEFGIDIGIRYGTGQWAGLASEKLFDEQVFPVCSPELAEQFADPAQLAQATLIHDVTLDTSAGFISWQQWFSHADIPAKPLKQGLHLDNSALALQSAIEGRGVALARSVLVQDDLASKRLVRLFPEINCLARLAYYVVFRAESGQLEKVRLFREWLGGILDFEAV